MLAFSTLSFTACFSSSVRFDESLTSVFSGRLGSMISAIDISGLSIISGSPVSYWNTRSSAGIVSFDPSGYVTVADPSSFTVTVVPSGNLSLLASSILSFTACFSLSVNLLGSLTPVFSGRLGSMVSAWVGVSSSTFSQTAVNITALSESTKSLLNCVDRSNALSVPSFTHFTNL